MILNRNVLRNLPTSNMPKPESAKNQFSMKRPSFIAGTIDKQKSSDVTLNKFLKLNQREGIGNNEIVRPSFLAQPPIPRMTKEFEQLQLLSADEAGQLIKPGDTSLSYKTRVQIPDATDFKWIDEKKRLTAMYRTQFTDAGYPLDQIQALINRELEINKPLGREQRKITKITDDVANINSLDIKQKLDEIIQEIKDGRGENVVEKQQITTQLALILTDTNRIDRLTRLQLSGLGRSLARIGFPTTYERLGLTARYVDRDFYKNNAGMINLLIFSKVREEDNDDDNFNYELCVKNYAEYDDDGLPAIKLTSAVSAIGRKPPKPKRYLDLKLGGVISENQLRDASEKYADGYDNPLFSILPENRV